MKLAIQLTKMWDKSHNTHELTNIPEISLPFCHDKVLVVIHINLLNRCCLDKHVCFWILFQVHLHFHVTF